MCGAGAAFGLIVGIAAIAAVATPSPGLAQAFQPPAAGVRTQDIDLIADLIYDSAVSGANAAVAGARRIRQSDEIFEPSIRFDLSRPIGRETVYLQGSAGYDFYRQNHFLNRENIDIHPGVLGRFGICQTSLSGEYSIAQSDLSELALTPQGAPTLTEAKNVREIKEVGGSADCGRASGLGISTSASQTWIDNSATIERFTNAATTSASFGLAYRRPTLGSLSLFGSYSHTDYPDRGALLLEVSGLSTGYNSWSGGATYTRAVGSRLQGSVSLSYTSLEPTNAGASGFSGLTYSAALTYLASSRLSGNLLVSRATVPSIRLNSSYAIDELYSGGVGYQLGRRITLGATVSYAHDSYDGIPYPLGFDLTDEKVYTVAVNGELRLNRRFSLGLSAEQRQRDANFPGLSYPETRVELSAHAHF